MPPWARAVAGGLALTIRLTPKSSRDAIDGAILAADGAVHLRIRVRAAPEDGKANGALETLIARAGGMPKSRVSVSAGHAARLKTVRVACAPDKAAAFVARLEAAFSP